MRASLLLAVSLLACAGPTSMGQNGDGGTTGSGEDGSVIGSGDGSVVISSNVSIIVEPNANHASELVSAINAAHTSVYMTMYQIDHTDILAALVARKAAGLDVQVILDGSTTCKSFNMPAYTQLSGAGIPVVWSSTAFTYTHEKTVMIDGATAWIMTMNLNTGPPSYNREYLAIDTDATDVAEAIAVFKADHAMQSITPTGDLVVANSNARPKLVALIASATKTVDVEVEELSDTYSTGIANAVAAAASRGVAVRVVIANATLEAADTTAIATAKAAGAKVVMTGPTSDNGTSSNPYIHAKAIVIDCVAGTCARGFVGSENFSGGSLGYNRELGVIFGNATELAKVEAAIATDFGHGTPQ